MKKKITGMVVGSIALSVVGVSKAGIVDYSKGKVSESRNVLIAKSDGEMTCGKEMKEKVKECKKMMEEASCGSKMKECKKILKKMKEASCGSCGSMMKTKEKAKEMACGSCGSMK